MQFREKGLKVLCIRSRYVPEKKRTVGDTVASQHISLSTVTDEVCQQLTKEEVEEFRNWLRKREDQDQARRQDRSISTLPYYLSRAAKALDNSANLDPKKADEVIEALGELKKSLRKRGIKLTRKKQEPKTYFLIHSPVESVDLQQPRLTTVDNAQ